MKRLLFIYAIILVSFSACRKDSLEIEDLGNSNNQEEFIEGNVSGLVLDQNGEALSNVEISLEGKTTTTDENGYFKYTQLAASDEGSLLTFEKDGYFKSYKFTYTSLNTNSFVNVRMVQAEETYRFKSAVGGESEFQNGARINIPSDAIVTSNGSDYTGDVIVKAHWFSPTENTTLETMPGDLRGINEDDEAVQLATYGMMAVELESPSGESLQLGNDKKAELEFPLPNEIVGSALQEIPLWHLDEQTGVWIEEGKAMLTNGSYIGEVSHFSFWNCDAPFDLVEIEGTLLNENGEIVAGYPVTIAVEGLNVSGYGYTNSNGVFKGKVPKDTPLSIRVHYCNTILLNESLGALTTDQNIGNFTVDFNDFAKQVTAKLVDCNNMPLVDAYAILRNGYYHTLLIPDSDGNVSGYVSGCGSPEIIFDARNPVSLTDAEQIILPADNIDQDLGSVAICESLEEYLTYVIDGGVTNLLGNADVFLVNDNLVYLSARDPGINLFVEFQIGLTDIGTKPVDNVDVYGYVDASELKYLLCYPQNGEECDFEVTFENKPEVGSFLIGSGIGEMSDDTIATGDRSLVEAEFRLEVDKSFTTGTIRGQAWADANNNGIRDNGELPFPGLYIGIKRVDDRLVYFNNETSQNVTDENGEYFINGLDPNGQYQLNFYTNNIYEVVDANQGSDDTKDSDFISMPSTSSYGTDIIELNDGEIVDHIDIGVYSNEINIVAYSTGCQPDATLIVNVQGGVGPLTVSLDNGLSSSGTILGGYRFQDIAAGDYQITVTDQLGNSATSSYSVPEFVNSLRGVVWEEVDNTNSVDNVLDLQDVPLKGVRIEIWDANGFFADVTTGSGYIGYGFSNIPPGMYKVVIPTIPAGYELVEMSIGSEDHDSDVDPITGESDFYEVFDCDSYIQIDLGFRKL